MRTILLAALAALLVACAGSPLAGFDIPQGTPRDAVLARLGQPYATVKLPGGGERLQYTTQPYGKWAWMVDLDRSGKVISSRQVLNEGDFNRIQPGWSRADVEREFGPPAWIDGVASFNGQVMTYRWRDVQGSDMFYWVYVDPQGVVRRAHPGMEFINAPNDKN